MRRAVLIGAVAALLLLLAGCGGGLVSETGTWTLESAAGEDGVLKASVRNMDSRPLSFPNGNRTRQKQGDKQ